MAALVMAGAPCVEKLEQEQKARVEALRQQGHTVCLAVVRVGDDPASIVYVRNKKKACERLGILSREVLLPGSITQADLEAELDALAADDAVDGMLLQLPLPKGLDEKRALSHIPYDKDADGFRGENAGSLITGTDGTLPCTPRGIMALLDFYGISLRGKSAVVVGRSAIVGKPVALMLLNADATVTICHSKTENLSKWTREADVIVAAVGKAGLITGDMIKPGAVLVDVGINRTEAGLKGDVDFDSVLEKASAVTPVPGGVGKMTVCMLMENVIELKERKVRALR